MQAGEALLPKHKRTSSQGIPSLDRQSSSIKALHSRQASPTRGAAIQKSPLRDTKSRIDKTQKLLDVLQFGQSLLQDQLPGQQGSDTSRFIMEVLNAQDHRKNSPVPVKQILPLRKVPELQSLLPPENRQQDQRGARHRSKGSSTLPNGYAPLMETASSVASVGLLDEAQLQETAPVVRVSAELLKAQGDGKSSKPQPITM